MIIWPLWILFSTVSYADLVRGFILEPNTHKLLFKFERTDDKKNNVSSIETKYQYPDGSIAVSEKALVENDKLVSYRQEQRQLNAVGSIHTSQQKLIFTYTINGNTETEEEDVTENLVVPPLTVPFLMKNWVKILNGETLHVRYGVVERKETVGFKFFKDADTQWNGEPGVVVKMKPSSIFIASAVKPILFTFKKDGTRLFATSGRTLPKIKKGDEWEDLVADTRYEVP